MNSRLILFISSALLFVSMNIFAVEGISGRTWDVGFHIGPIFEGAVNVDPPDEEFDTDGGFLWGIDLDGYTGERLSMGLRILGTSVDLSEYSDVTLQITSINGTIKGHIPLGVKSEFRPGFIVGYNSITPDGTDLDDSAGLNLGLAAGYAYKINPRSCITAEFSFLSQVTGGGDDYDLTFAPIPFLQLGYEFGN